MSSSHGDYLSEESEDGSQPVVVIPAPTPPTAQQLTLEDLQLMQQMGLTLSDSESQQGIRIPVEPGQLLMGNGPLPMQAEEEGEGYIMNHDVESEEEEEESQSMATEPESEE